MKISICREDNSTVFPPYLKRTFKCPRGDSCQCSLNYYKTIITLRKAHPESNSITIDVCISLVHWYGDIECIKYEIYINETTLTWIYYHIFTKICQPSPVFLYLVPFYCYISVSSRK
jgi:hypothetical protein